MSKSRTDKKDGNQEQSLPAGEFSSWMRQIRHAQKVKKSGTTVPCGECTACCRSSLFVHIKPEEKETLKHIPKKLLFPAPGSPKGNVLMGYDSDGKCPMLIDNKCSIYKFRPQTCRDFDCRVFAATGIEMDSLAQKLIVERARQWKFAYPDEENNNEQFALHSTVRFLREQKNLFPVKFLPSNPTQLALLAIKVFKVFKANQNTGVKEEVRSEVEIARAISREFESFEVDS